VLPVTTPSGVTSKIHASKKRDWKDQRNQNDQRTL